ncbi:MAG: TetR/AcrR family transcriptional regulator [Chitinophagaceae bacterium]|nr:TetR/AcrR family transcriptional regulator [Chitinophagaceae bacterium]
MRTRSTDKEQLVKQKAVELLAKDGFEGFSMNKLARCCSISVATLYIYYKDKDDLIIKIAGEKAKDMTDAIFRDFNPEAPFGEGLRIQWKNRYRYMTQNPLLSLFFDQLRSSSYQHKLFKSFMDEFASRMGSFCRNAVQRGEIKEMPPAVFWSVAFAPLYTLIRFHNEGQTIGGKPFKATDTLLWQTFDLVIKALKI